MNQQDEDKKMNKIIIHRPRFTLIELLVVIAIIAILAANGDKNPTVIVFPTLIVTFIAFTFAIFIAKVFEKLWKPQEVENND